MAKSIDAGALSLGVGALVTTAGGLWKSARLRSDLIAEFQGRLALAQAALDERAASDLRNLSERVKVCWVRLTPSIRIKLSLTPRSYRLTLTTSAVSSKRGSTFHVASAECSRLAQP